jgi:transposase-like protein
MKFTQDVANRIIARLNAVIPDMKCPLCRTDDWIVANGYVFLQVHEHTSSIYRELYRKSSEMPCVAITCKYCGNTHLLNLLQLGLGDLLKD